MHDQRAGIVEQNLVRDPAESLEGAFHPGEPTRLLLVTERLDVDPSRVTKGRHEEEYPRRHAVDLDPSFAEVDLQLLARWGLEAHRRTCLRHQFLSERGHRTFDRAQAHRDGLLGGKFLTDDVGVPAVTPEALAQPVGQPVEPLRARDRRTGSPGALAKPALHRVLRTAKLHSDPPRPPSPMI